MALWLLAAPLAHAQDGAPRDAGARLFAARRYDDARAQLTAALAADPRDARSALLLGEIALVEGDGAEAAQWLERAASLASRDAQAQWWLGRAYAREAAHAGRWAQLRLAGKVRAAFERAVSLDPANAGARLDLFRVYLVAPGFAGGGTDKAAAQAREIARLSAWRGHLAAGALAEKAHDGARAEQEYRAAIGAAPDSAEGYAALGAMYERAKKWPQALALYDTLLARGGGDGVAHSHIGRAASISGQELARGARSLERYVATAPAPGDPSLASAWYRLGLVYQRQGDSAGARRAFERTLALDPKQSEARDALGKLR